MKSKTEIRNEIQKQKKKLLKIKEDMYVAGSSVHMLDQLNMLIRQQELVREKIDTLQWILK